MDEKHKKRGRRSHLNDFHLNVAGEYVYDGSFFACRSSEKSLRGSKTFTDLLKNAGLESPFDEKCLRGVCAEAEKALGDFDLSGIE